jgi:plasmid stabilization system protein ParE
MARILRSPRAKADVLSIGGHIAKQSQSRSIALRFLDKIDDGIEVLRILHGSRDIPRVFRSGKN